MDERLKLVRTEIESYIGDLFERANDTSTRFQDYTVKGNAGRGWGEQNTLSYRVRREKNALMLEWYCRIWKTDAKGKRHTEHEYIRKRNKNKRGTDMVYGYDLGDLFKFAADWSKERVVEVETEAKAFRRQAHYCASMLIVLGRLERYLGELGGLEVSKEETL